MEKEYYISSTKYSLQERMTKRGKVYDVVFRICTHDGTEKQKKLSGYATKTLAKQGYVDFVTEKCELVKNNPIRRQKRAEKGRDVLTVNELAKSYFAVMRNQIKDSTIYEKIKIFDLFVLPQFGTFAPHQLTKQVLSTWQDEIWSMRNPRTGEYYSYKYLCKLRTFFSAFLTWCEDRSPGFVNLLITVKKPKRRTPKKIMQFWTREEFAKFIACVDNPMYRALFSMLFYTGRRKGEVLSLSPEDVKDTSINFSKSLTRKTLDGSIFAITSTKNEKVASTPICEALRVELAKYTVPKGRFYFGDDRPIPETTLSRVFDRYIDTAGVRRIRIHDLRHSFVSMIIHLGANLTVVADLIGDTLSQVTQTYAHLYVEDKHSILKKIV